MDYLSLAQQGLGYVAYPATKGTYRRAEKTFDPNPTDWVFSRVKTEKSITVEDNTGFLASGVGLPDIQPELTKTFHPSIHRVESVEVKGSDGQAVTTAFTFQGTTGLAATEWLNAYLTSATFGLSGKLGVSAYGYDANGYLNAISQQPNAGTTLTVNQTSDELGRPLTQTGLDGTVKAFHWDDAGRLSSLTSSDGDETTGIAYDDTDHRGIKVTHGAQVSEFRYNGFGQLILERRKGPDELWSHRIHGYDSAGRKTGETVWLPGDGALHEGQWSNPALTRSNTITTVTPEQTICRRWGFDGDGNAICLTWQTIPASSTATTTAALYPGVATRYDGRGRVALTQDANGIETTTTYFGSGSLPPGVSTYVGPIKKITVGSSQVRWFESDAAGRLVRVTTPVTRYADPLRTNVAIVQNLNTEYRYDGGDRIKEVKQLDEAGRIQTRTWGTTAWAG
jgi:YD repeat-containing protein